MTRQQPPHDPKSDGGDDRWNPQFQYYRDRYLEAGFNEFAASHLASMGAWFDGSAQPLFKDTLQIGEASKEYAALYEELRDLSTGVTTRTEVYFLQALAEGYVLNDFNHTALKLNICRHLSVAQVDKSAFVCPKDKLWWPSIGEHFWNLDYYPVVESFTQLTDLFALAHANPSLAISLLDQLKSDAKLYDQESERWLDSKFAYEDEIERRREYSSRDQLMYVCLLGIIEPQEASNTLARYKASKLYDGCNPLSSESDDGLEDEDINTLDKLLLITAEVFVCPPEKRSEKVEELKAVKGSPFNRETSSWFTKPNDRADWHPSEDMMASLLSVILNRISTGRS